MATDTNGTDLGDRKNGITTEGLTFQNLNFNTKIFSTKPQDVNIRAIQSYRTEILTHKTEEKILMLIALWNTEHKKIVLFYLFYTSFREYK